MRATVRFLLAFILSLLIEFGFIEILESIKKPQREEVRQVIEISLIKQREQKVKVEVERKIEKKRKKKTKKTSIPRKRPEIVSKKPLKKLPEKQKKKKEKPEKPGGLKSLQGNLPAYYIYAIRNAIEENIFYPIEAIERGEEGIVSVNFTLNRGGKVVECESLNGKSRISQEATCIAIKRAEFPPIPDTIKNDKLTFQLEIEYNLESVK
jgi:protein TonB